MTSEAKCVPSLVLEGAVERDETGTKYELLPLKELQVDGTMQLSRLAVISRIL
jgi:hypothetical protein